MVDTGVGGDTGDSGLSLVALTAAPLLLFLPSVQCAIKKLPVIVRDSKPTPSHRQIEMNKYHRRKSRKCHGEDDV